MEQVEVFKYLGHLLLQDDNNVQTIHNQLRTAWATWERVGQVLHAENVSPCIAAKFCKAVVQAVLLYGSKMWVLSKPTLVSLEGFHIRAAYCMAKNNTPWQGRNHGWFYLRLKDVLEECGLSTVEEYISVHQQMIAVYVATRLIPHECRQGKRKRGAVLHRWWWKQPMDLDANNVLASGK